MLLKQLSAPTEQHNALTAMLTHKNAFCLIKDNVFESVDVKSKVFWWGWTFDMHADTDLLRNAEYEDRRQSARQYARWYSTNVQFNQSLQVTASFVRFRLRVYPSREPLEGCRGVTSTGHIKLNKEKKFDALGKPLTPYFFPISFPSPSASIFTIFTLS